MDKEETVRYADIFAALGSESRLEIMRLLFAAYPDGLTVGDLQAQLKIPNSTLSHHLEKLRVEELVTSRRDRQFLWYSVNANAVEELLSFLYNGCRLVMAVSQEDIRQSDATYQAIELTEVIPKQEGLMFERFLRSVETLLRDWFGAVALPTGFERFTQRAAQVVFLAQEESQRLQHRYVGTEQILLGLIREGTGTAAQVLTTAGVSLDAVQQRVEQYIGQGNGTPIEIPFTPRAKQLLRLAVEQSRQLGHAYIGTEHLLLGLLHEGNGLGARVLEELGFDLRSLEQQVRSAL